MDKLSIKILKPQLFCAVSDSYCLLPEAQAAKVAIKIDVMPQMLSESDYENTMDTADAAASAMWWMLILFVFTKLMYSFSMDAIWATITFCQIMIFFQHLPSIHLPAPTEIVFEQLDSMVNFNISKYPEIEDFVYEHSASAMEFLT